MNSIINYNPDVLDALANLSNDEVFTPPKVVNQILDTLPVELWKDKNATFLDPATKSGVFLREIAKRLIQGLEKEIPDLQERLNHIFTKQLFGIAITELTSLLSRRSLYCSKYANSKYSVSTAFDTTIGNVVFNKTLHRWKNGKCSQCGASQGEYDRDKSLETHAYEFIHKSPTEILKLFNNTNMKFDVIIGNPPYQLSDGGSKASASPLYDKFVEQAKKLSPRYLSMIIPARWFAGGKGLDNFRNEMINDNRISNLVDYNNAKECFPGTSIGGGVCYFLWERDYKGQCIVINITNGNRNERKRMLNEHSIFVRNNNALDILEKVRSISKVSLADIVSSRNPFGLSSSTRGEKREFSGSVKLYSSEGVSFINKKDITKENYLKSYKVMVSKVTSEHAGEPDKNGMYKILAQTRILEPDEVCTDSYIVVGRFLTYNECENLYRYLITKFARFLLLQAVTSINLSKDKFSFIPLQDFTQEWTDEKLYKKYNLIQEEIDFIESMIRPMD